MSGFRSSTNLLTRVLPVFLVCSLVISGQSLTETISKAPPDVEEALKARVEEFFGLLAAGKFRQAEALVAEDTKDRYYAADKDQTEGFSLVKIAYKENFTQANVVGLKMVSWSVPGAAQPVKLKATFTSYWKIDNGKWCWYLPPEPEFLETPYGKMRNPKFAGNKQATPEDAMKIQAAMAEAQRNMNDIAANAQAGVRVNPPVIHLAPKFSKGEVSITNGLPGSVKLRLGRLEVPGLELTLSTDELASKQSAVLRAVYNPGNHREPMKKAVTLDVTVEPTNQKLSIILDFAQPMN